MNNEMLGKVMLIEWARLGIVIDKSEETTEALTYWISVPEHSFQHMENGTELGGMNLARRFKQILTDMGVKRLVVKANVHKGVYWTKEMADYAEEQMRKSLYGSQW